MLQKPVHRSGDAPPERPAPGEGASARTAAVAAVIVLALAFGFLFREAVMGAVGVWYDSRTFNHCFLVLPISLYLIWDRRAELVNLVPRPSFWPLFLLVPLSLLWLLGHFAGVMEIQQLLIIALIQVALLSVLGWPIYRLLLFPLLYLFFLVPTGEFLVPSMQDFTASFVVHGLQIIGIPVYSNGVFITIPNGSFEVAEACAGLRFLIASIAFGFLYAYVVYRSWGRRLLFIGLSLVVPLIANGFRALGIVLLAYYSNNRIAVGFDHIIYGWIFFSMVTLTLIWLGFFMREGPISVPPGTLVSQPPRPVSGWRIAMVTALALVLVGAPRAFAAWRDGTKPAIDAKALVAPPMSPPWSLMTTIDPWRPVFATANATLRRDYDDAGSRVYLYIAFYAKQKYQAKVISSANRFDDDKLWTRSDSGGTTAEVAGRPMRLLTERLRGSRNKRLIWYWYWVDGDFTANRLMAKLLEAKTEILGGDRSAAVIAVAADYDDDPAEAAHRLKTFLAVMPSLGPMLERVAQPASGGATPRNAPSPARRAAGGG